MNHHPGDLNEGVGFSDGRLHLSNERTTVWAVGSHRKRNNVVKSYTRTRGVFFVLAVRAGLPGAMVFECELASFWALTVSWEVAMVLTQMSHEVIVGFLAGLSRRSSSFQTR